MNFSVKNPNPWSWIPTLYFAEGIPYVVVMTVAVIMYKRLGLSNTDITLYTSWLYLPWVIKPLWSPIVDILKSKRWWIVIMQVIIGAAMAGVAFSLPANNYIQWTLAFFWLMAFSSATHDIAADGFYMLALDEEDQSFFVGIRSTFYRVATIMGQGGLIAVAGVLETMFRIPEKAWSYTFYAVAILFFGLFFYHWLMLPRPQSDNERTTSTANIFQSFGETFVSFLRKPQIVVAIIFMLVYRLPEALLVKICPLFLIDPISAGGLGLTTADIGLVQGTVGVVGLTLGGIIGGIAVANGGLKRWLWPMVVAITIPNVVYVALAYFQPEYTTSTGFYVINSAVFLEQFGYGFGFTAYMLYMILFSQGASKTAHYAFCTGFMALGMMLPGMVAGWLQEQLNYLNYFILVIALCPLTFFVASIIKIEKPEEE